MPTYIQKTTASDLSPFADGNREMSDGTGSDTSFTVNAANGGGQETHGFITPADVPNNDDWETGAINPVEIEIDSGDSDVTCQCRAVRLDAAGNVEESGAFTSTQAMDASRTFNCAEPGGGWGSGGDAIACGDRIAIECLFTNNAAHGGHSIDVGLGTTSNEVVTVILEDVAACVVADLVSVSFTPLYELLGGS